MHRIAILALEGFVPFDLSIPFEVFSKVTLAGGDKPYAVSFCGPDEAARSGAFTITGVLPLEALARMDSVIVPGMLDPLAYREPAVLAALRRAASSGARLASICTGACVLAAAGLLDGLRATTHWALAQAFAAAYPAVAVDADVLFVDNGQVLTSAGLASGIDLCLHMIRKDCGSKAAEDVATFFVTPLEREGGCRQFARRSHPQSGDNLAELHLWLLENLHLPLALGDMARQACMSPRTLHRKFKEQTGAAPMEWLTRARVRRGQTLLETGSLSVEQIAAATGFGSATAFRESFRRLVGVSPTAWRKTYSRV